MRRLCVESSRSYPGRSVQLAGWAAMEVELTAIPKGLGHPSNPKAASVARGAGLRAAAKAVEPPPDPTATRPARAAATPGVTGQESAEAIVAPPTRSAGEAKGRT